MKSRFILFSSLSFLLFSCGGSTENDEEKDTVSNDSTETYVESATSSTCDCESSWFDGSIINAPKEGVDSPFAASSTTNCLFHQWSWQKFLYLTQVPSGESLPYFLSKMNQVNSEMAPVSSSSATLALTEYQQAGGGGILASNATYGTQNTVYYSLHITDSFEKTAKDAEQAIKSGTMSPTNRETFPVGAVELKVSWVEENAIPSNERDQYYSTTATIGDNEDVVNVLLLGMHVVGVVENHPEFIWATFEHEDLAAYFDWSSTTSSQDAPVTASNNLPFFNSNDQANLTDIQWSGSSPRNPNNVFTINKYGTPRVAGNGFMTGTSQTDGATNYNNIDQLNQSVKDSLTAHNVALWGNYFYNGSIWMNTDGYTKDQQIDSLLARATDFGDANAGGPLRGSMNAFNITMETYEQTMSKKSIHAMSVDSLMNCMDCHGPQSYLTINGESNAQSPLYLSHIFMNYMHEDDPGMTLDQIIDKRFKKFKAYRQE